MKITITDLANATGFSKTTVSHALNDKGVVNERTRALIKQKAQEMGYVPDGAASQLRTGQKNTIAIISSMPLATSNSKAKLGFLLSITAEVAHSAFEQGYSLVVVPPIHQPSDFSKLNNIAGAIFVEPVSDDLCVEYLQSSKIPYVSIGRSLQITDEHHFVDLNYESIATLLVEHLLAQGCKHIGLIIGQSNRLSQQVTARVYEQLMQAKQLPLYIHKGDEREGKYAGINAAQAMLAMHPQLDGLCVLIDTFAEGVMEALIDLDIQIPRDIKVCTRYDGIIAQTAQPPLTAVDLSLGHAARLALTKLVQQMRGQTIQRDEPRDITPILVTRPSTESVTDDETVK